VKTFASLALAGVTALALSGTGASSTTECQIVPPVTVSPTKARLWTWASRGGAWNATPHFVNSDGSIWLKAPWFAAGPRGRSVQGPNGVLTITGKRLDGEAAPLAARTRQVSVPGFGGSGVWAVVLTFPSDGCWTVTGRVARTTHTFLLQVTKVA
jgi:hypothetical protein